MLIREFELLLCRILAGCQYFDVLVLVSKFFLNLINRFLNQPVVLIQLFQLNSFDEELVLVRWTGRAEKLTGHILRQDVHGVVKLQAEAVGDGFQFSFFGRDDAPIFGLDFEPARSILREVALDNDGLSIVVRQVGALALILDSNDDDSIPERNCQCAKLSVQIKRALTLSPP